MIFAQDGFGVANKISEGYSAGYLDGTILSIKNRSPETISQVVAGMLSHNPDKELLLDTHFYASQMTMTRPGNIPDYQLYDHGLGRKDFSIKNISNYARRLVDYQRELGLNNIIIPSLTISNFDDFTSQISLQLYEASLEYISDIGASAQAKAYLSLVFHENALQDNEKLSEYLDEITLFDNVEGFYLVVERNPNSLPQWQDSRTLAKLMYIVNSLSDNYKVICGYTDFPGLLLLAAGAQHVASGWFQTLRNYTAAYFIESGGSNNGKFRYPSKELLGQILSEPDLQSIVRRGFADTYVDSEYGAGLKDPDNLVLGQPARVLQQWKVLKSLGDSIVSASDPMTKLEEYITAAENNLSSLQSAGIVVDRASVAHYDVWRQAISKFREGVL